MPYQEMIDTIHKQASLLAKKSQASWDRWMGGEEEEQKRYQILAEIVDNLDNAIDGLFKLRHLT